MLRGKAIKLIISLFAFVTLLTLQTVTTMASDASFEIVTEDTYHYDPNTDATTNTSSTSSVTNSTSTVSPGEPVHGYILPDTDTHMYYRSDIVDMPLQVVNYAKNEVYARHNRKFESNELATYFNAQPWYNGTIEPDDFEEDNLERVMNDTEIANITTLALYEIELTNNELYQLDQPGYNYDKVSEYIRNHGQVIEDSQTTDAAVQPTQAPTQVFTQNTETPSLTHTTDTDTVFVTTETDEPTHGFLLPNADVKYYTEDELSHMSEQVLCYARNEIYARHGYVFQSNELSTYFNQQPWYQNLPVSNDTFEDVEADFTDAEAQNVELIAFMEEESPNPYVTDTSDISYTAVSYYIEHYGLVAEDTNLH